MQKILRDLKASILELLGRTWPTWTSLGKLGRDKLLRSSYLWFFFVPIAAKYIAKFGDEITIDLLTFHFTLALELPFRWKILYFSSVSFALASFIYSLSCPPIIKHYRSFAEFKNEGKGGTQITEYLHNLLWYKHGIYNTDAVDYMIIFVNRFSSNTQLSGNRQTYIVNPASVGMTLYQSDISVDKQPEAFWYVRTLVDKTNLISRKLCMIFYGIGFILFFIVLGQNFLYVWHLALK